MEGLRAVGMRTHVAVVDDDAAYLRAVQRSVGRRRHALHLSLLRSGRELIAHAERERPALVVMDVNMPGIGGIETCEQLKSRPETRDLRIVLASTGLCREIAEAALEAGADRVLVKPYDLATVVAALLHAPPIPEGSRALELIHEHLPVTRTLAGKLATRMRPLVSHDDVDALAFLGLCDAALRWTADLGEPFRWYAERCVREAVDRQLAQVGLRWSTNLDGVRRLAAAKWALVCAGIEPTDVNLNGQAGS